MMLALHLQLQQYNLVLSNLGFNPT